MSLNIKNPRVHRLAREAAGLTGKTQTGAIQEALEQLIVSYGADPDATEINAQQDRLDHIIDWFWSAPADSEAPLQSVEDLYDDATGLPA